MKLHLTLLTFILISINSVFSQNNNLQFNRALFEEFTITVPLNSTNVSINAYNTSIGNLIVPTGKVWKIESTNTLKKTFLDATNFYHEYGSSSYMINHFFFSRFSLSYLASCRYLSNNLKSIGKWVPKSN